jgi:hypothetical protein
MKKLLTIVFALFAVTLLTSCNLHYSDGARVGQLYKFSKKGVINKTWEGILKTGYIAQNQNGAMVAEEFVFSVTDENVAKQLQEVLLHPDQKVELQYDQLILNPPFVSPDSQYRIKSVKLL